jgi:hypothetical protein
MKAAKVNSRGDLSGVTVLWGLSEKVGRKGGKERQYVGVDSSEELARLSDNIRDLDSLSGNELGLWNEMMIRSTNALSLRGAVSAGAIKLRRFTLRLTLERRLRYRNYLAEVLSTEVLNDDLSTTVVLDNLVIGVFGSSTVDGGGARRLPDSDSVLTDILCKKRKWVNTLQTADWRTWSHRTKLETNPEQQRCYDQQKRLTIF